jgi:hypothetical protein
VAEKTEIQSASDFKDDKRGLAARWTIELEAAKKEQEKWHKQADKIIKRFLSKSDEGAPASDQRVNLFTANVQTQRALMYGKTPKIECKRRFDDARDDVARVGAEILERLLNADITRDGDGYRDALALALDDVLLPGMGQCRIRYEADFDMVDVPPIKKLDPELGVEVELAPGYQKEEKSREDVITDHVQWRDFRWSPARTWGEVRWLAFRSYLTKDQISERYGKKVAKQVPLTSKGKGQSTEERAEPMKYDPWSRAEVWEIWDKSDRKVYHFCQGAPEMLDVQEDPLELDGFFPCPRPLVANLTTDQFIPTPDFMLAQDLYNEIDNVSSRITLLERAVRVAGVYDAGSEGLQRLVNGDAENILYPVENWGAFLEKGGVQGAIAFLPLAEIVGALDKLRDYRSELTRLLYEVTGMSDIMRGQSTEGATATEQAIKAKFASVRMQYRQDEFARFASDLQRLRAEVISKHFDDANISERANVTGMYDEQTIAAAIELLRKDSAKYRIEVKPESVSLTDFAALQQERVGFLQAFTMFMQSATPMIQAMPEAATPLVEVLKWVMASFRGSSTIEGVMDQTLDMIKAKLSQPPQPPPPDPKVEILKMKAQTDIGVAKQKGQIDMAKGMMDMKMKAQTNQMDLQKKQADLQLDTQKQRMQFGMEMARESQRANRPDAGAQ